MKKLKYILCFAIAWVWVLLNSFTYAQVFLPDEDTPQDWFSYFQWNVISSANWAKLTFSDSALLEWIWKPLFTRWWNLINLAIKFFPVFLLIAFFGISLSAIKNVWKIKKEKKDKDLENK